MRQVHLTSEPRTALAFLATLVGNDRFFKRVSPEYQLLMIRMHEVVSSWKRTELGLLNPHDTKCEKVLLMAFHHAWIQSGVRPHRVKFLLAFSELMHQLAQIEPSGNLRIKYEPTPHFNHKAMIEFKLDGESFYAQIESKRMAERFPILQVEIWETRGEISRGNILGTLLIGCDNNFGKKPHFDITDSTAISNNHKWVHQYPLEIWNDGELMGRFIANFFSMLIVPLVERNTEQAATEF